MKIYLVSLIKTETKGDLNKIKVYKLTSTNAGKAGSVQATRVSLGLLSTFNIILLKMNCIFYENSLYINDSFNMIKCVILENKYLGVVCHNDGGAVHGVLGVWTQV